jgi:hypothetical protein
VAYTQECIPDSLVNEAHKKGRNVHGGVAASDQRRHRIVAEPRAS